LRPIITLVASTPYLSQAALRPRLETQTIEPWPRSFLRDLIRKNPTYGKMRA